MTLTAHSNFEPSTARFAPDQLSGTSIAFFLLCIYFLVHLDAAQSLGISALYFLSRLWNRAVSMTPFSLLSRKPFGLDTEDLLKGLQPDASLNVFGLFKGRTSSRTLPGLGNWDNSCYQNSVLQALASLPDFHAFLTQTSQATSDISEETTNDALREIISNLNDPARGGQVLWTPSKLKSMSTWQQQDAQEYFSKIIDQMEKDIAGTWKPLVKAKGLEVIPILEEGGQATDLAEQTDGTSSESKLAQHERTLTEIDNQSPVSNTSPLENPLEGFLGQRVACMTCRYCEGFSLIPFNCLTVPLGDRNSYDLQECLDEYTKLEVIDEVECTKCTLLHTRHALEQLSLGSSNGNSDVKALQESIQTRLDAIKTALDDEDFSDNTLTKRCQIPKKNRVSSAKSRQAIIAKPPRNLVIHVNRSVFEEFTGVQRKNYAEVSFPKDLNLSSWCLGRFPLGECDSEKESEESWSLDPRQSLLAGQAPASASSKMEYELRAVITHYGRHENGHYICYRKCALPSDDEARDQDGSESKEQAEEEWWRLSDEDVSPVSEEDILRQGGVFMLFYERRRMMPAAPNGTPNTLPVPVTEHQQSEPAETMTDEDTREQPSPSKGGSHVDSTEYLEPENAKPIASEPISLDTQETNALLQPEPKQATSTMDYSMADHEPATTTSIVEDDSGSPAAAESEPLTPSTTIMQAPQLRHMRTSRSDGKQKDSSFSSSQPPMVAAT